MFRIFRILVEFPALDRLLDRLDNEEQAQSEIDALTQRVKNLSARLKAALSEER